MSAHSSPCGVEDPDHKSTTHNVVDPLVLQNSCTIWDGVFMVSSPHLWRALYSFHDRFPYSHSRLVDPNPKCGAGCSSMTSKRHRNLAICEDSRKNKEIVTQQTAAHNPCFLKCFCAELQSFQLRSSSGLTMQTSVRHSSNFRLPFKCF